MRRNTWNAEKNAAEKNVEQTAPEAAAAHRPARRGLLARVAAGMAALVLAVTVAACGGTATDSGADASSETTQEEQAVVTATVEIDGTAGEGESTTYDVEVPEGSTVYDALVATGADVNASDSDYGMYVEGIDGLASGDYGDMSGWMFEVNGEMAEVSCSELEVADGDEIVWTYVTEFTE